MKWVCCVLLFLVLTGGLVQALYGENRVLIDAESSIYAGDAWELSLVIEGAEAGTQAQVSLVNGLLVIEEMLTLGTGGVALWEIDAGKLTQAGDTLVLIRHEGEEYRHLLHVLPGSPSDVDLFSTANALPAYGEGMATIMVLLRDEWGNAPQEVLRFPLAVRFPRAAQTVYTLQYSDGIAWFPLVTRGIPGRVRLMIDHNDMSAALELMQMPGSPDTITLTVSPDCVLDDGRDVIELTAHVSDSHDHAVADGTLVIFSWDDGFGYGRTIDGQADLRLPSQQHTGRYRFRAAVGDATSTAAYLRVTEEGCADE